MSAPAKMARLVVVMGVSGSGKSTIAETLARTFDWSFQEGDALHPVANVEKMRSGTPLTDEDRAPWLALCHDWLARHEAEGGVLSCSALKRTYRDMLRSGLSDVLFVYLHTDAALIEQRMAHRSGHFMPPVLLRSQLATLEPPGADENAISIESSLTPEAIIATIERALRSGGPCSPHQAA